ncbi:MAG: sensor histidine kinase, partial [Candidatus Binatia bacterium]
HRDVRSEGKTVARLFIESDLRQLTDRLSRYFGIVAAVLVAALVVARLISSRLQQTISAPILSLVETTRRVSRERDYSVRAVAQSRDELGLLVEGFNEMLGQIEQRDEALRRGRDELERRVEERTHDLRQEVRERHLAEQLLGRQARDLSRSNAELEQFAYVASHDLQEPLRMVGSYTQLLARRYRGRLDADADEFIGFAVDGVSRMQTLIGDLLAYSRVGSRGTAFEETSCERIIAESLANLRTVIEESGAEVTHGPLPMIQGDPPQMLQLFQNLIGNAIKFRAEGAPRVRVDAVRDGADWRFSVTDNGIGIDPEYRERIFVIFQRLHGRGEYPGTGIGLAICKKIVERHGGRIWVESAPGKGSTFFFTIPAAARSEG